MKRRFRIQITRAGYAFLGVCLGVGMAGLNTGNNLLYLIFSMMLSFIILSGILSNSTLYGILIEPQFPSRIFAEEAVPVRMSLRNVKKYFPSFSITVRPVSAKLSAEIAAFVVKLPANASETTVAQVTFGRRGRVKLPEIQAETTYPFGFIRKYIRIPTEEETIVYPKVVDLDPTFRSQHLRFGEFLSNVSGGSSNPFGVRDFVYGDAARLIHWKTTARTGSLKVKEFEKEKRQRMTIFVRLVDRSDGKTSLVEETVSVATTLILELSKRNFELSLVLNGAYVDTEGRRYVDAFLTSLALAQPARDAGALREPRTTDTLVMVTNDPSARAPENCALFFGPRHLAGL